MRRAGETLRTKRKKAESLERFQLALLWRVPESWKSCATCSGTIASEVCLILCLFHFYTDFFLWKPTFHASVANRLRHAVCKTVRFAALEVRIFPDAIRFGIRDWWLRIEIQNLITEFPNQNVSETQTAECRSSKPNVAGSIPVAHSLDLGF